MQDVDTSRDSFIDDASATPMLKQPVTPDIKAIYGISYGIFEKVIEQYD